MAIPPIDTQCTWIYICRPKYIYIYNVHRKSDDSHIHCLATPTFSLTAVGRCPSRASRGSCGRPSARCWPPARPPASAHAACGGWTGGHGGRRGQGAGWDKMKGSTGSSKLYTCTRILVLEAIQRMTCTHCLSSATCWWHTLYDGLLGIILYKVRVHVHVHYRWKVYKRYVNL